MTQQSRETRHGFGWIELFICIGALTVLAILLLPYLHMRREQARRVSCKNNLRQIGLAIHQYNEMHRAFPPGYVNVDDRNLISWSTFILAGMEQDPLQKQIISETDKWQCSWYDANHTGANDQVIPSAYIVIPAYNCPSDPMDGINTEVSISVNGTSVQVGKLNYKGVGQKDETNRKGGFGDLAFGLNSCRHVRDFIDGTANTFIVGEVTSLGVHQAGIWIGDDGTSRLTLAAPQSLIDGELVSTSINDSNKDRGFNSAHQGGAHFLIADGSVHFVSEEVDKIVYDALATINGREDLGKQ